MRIVRALPSPVPEIQRGIVALGNFDGVHRGHQALLAKAREFARAEGAPLVVLTFEPHPRQVFAPDAPPFRLTPFRTKARLLADLGVDVLVALPFRPALYTKSAQAFVEDILIAGLAPRRIVVGYDFVFGHKRGGSTADLVAMGAERGFEVSILEPVLHENDVCSSTIIRVDLESARVRRAAELLHHWWEVEGRVRRGDQRGHSIGFATANVHLRAAALQPPLGVYAVHACVSGPADPDWRPAVANLGRRPTFGGERVILETHIFDFDQDIYGRGLRIAFVDHLRAERRFDGIDALLAQIRQDAEQARAILRRPENAAGRFAFDPG